MSIFFPISAPSPIPSSTTIRSITTPTQRVTQSSRKCWPGNLPVGQYPHSEQSTNRRLQASKSDQRFKRTESKKEQHRHEGWTSHSRASGHGRGNGRQTATARLDSAADSQP